MVGFHFCIPTPPPPTVEIGFRSGSMRNSCALLIKFISIIIGGNYKMSKTGIDWNLGVGRGLEPPCVPHKSIYSLKMHISYAILQRKRFFF